MRPALMAAATAALLASAPSVDAAPKRGFAAERFTEPGDGSVNTYIVNAPAGLIVIDFQRDTKSAAEAIARVRARGRPVVALLLTHTHPDHIGGLDQFKKAFPAARLYASKETADELANDTLGFQKLAKGGLGAVAPAAYPHADKVIDMSKPLTLGGLRIEPVELGAGESISTTAYYIPSARALFAGDIAIDGMTDFLMEGRTGPWLRQIDTLLRKFPAARTIYPGHGAPGPAAKLLTDEATYLTFVRDRVAARLKDGKLDPAARAAVVAEVDQRFGVRPPVAEIPDMKSLNIDAVARELVAAPGGIPGK